MAKFKATKKPEGHNKQGRVCNFVFCTRCGTVYLSNKATEKHFNKPCPADAD